MMHAGTSSRRHALLLAAAVISFVTGSTPAGAEEESRAVRLLVKHRAGRSVSDLDGALARFTHRSTHRAWGSRLTRWSEVVVGSDDDPGLLIAALMKDPSVERVEREHFARATALPDDLGQSQWWMDNTGQAILGTVGSFDADMDAPEAWELSHGSRGVVVAVLDTGVQTDHPDLSPNLLAGYDFYNGDANPTDDVAFGHGTAVAGIIGAVGDNGTGLTGLNWEVGLLPVKVCSGTGLCPYAAIVAGMEYAVARGAKVINLSMACDEHQDPVTGSCNASRPGACYSEALADAIGVAAQSGVLVVTAAGNCGADLSGPARAYPCSYDLPGLLCVGATDARDEMATFSNHGAVNVRLAAPGVSILSLSTAGAGPAMRDGTSFAAPMASGVGALTLARNSTLTGPALAARLVGAGDTLASLDGMVSRSVRLNAHGAVKDLFLSPLTASGSTGGELNLVADFNGDGLSDVLESSRDAGCRVALSDGATLGAFEMWSVAPIGRRTIAADFDGDGRADVARIGPIGVEVMRSTGSGFEAAVPWWAGRLGLSPTAADVDGDGRADLMTHRRREGWFVSRSNGAGFSPPVRWSTSRLSRLADFVDVNGDGRADLVMWLSDQLQVSLSTGSSFDLPAVWGATDATPTSIRGGDVNGDGFADIATLRDGCWSVHLTGDGAFLTPRPWGCDPAGARGFLGRFDQDRRADLLRVSREQGWEFLRSAE